MADDVFGKVMQKAAEKKQAAKERKEAREEAGEVNKLVIERTPAGLFFVRYSMHGPVPDALKGLFTRKERIIETAKLLGKPLEM